MAEWTGATKGGLWGYKIFVFSVRNFGLWFAYFLLIFVAFYYFLFSWESSRNIFYLYRKRLKFSWIKSVVGIYRSYYVFGQTLIDRILIASGKRDRFTYEFDGVENLIDTFQDGNGAILISAHLGNFEVSEYFLDGIADDIKTSILTTDREKQNIKNYLEQFSLKSKNKYIVLGEDMSHLFEINDVLSKNGFFCITGDRFTKQEKLLEAEFLGKTAKFPAGPFLISSRLKRPVLFVYVMKDGPTYYHLYARKVEVDFNRKEKVLLEEYIKSITELIEKYPYQWYNYYKFWE